MSIEIEITHSCPLWSAGLSDAAGLCRRAAFAALVEASERRSDAAARLIEISIVLTDDQSVAELNLQFRGRAGATNVLSFPAYEKEDEMFHPMRLAGLGDPEGPPILLGDVVLAFETIATEAAEQGKTVSDHCTHLVVHGILHLLGYDHLNDSEAKFMEQLEIRVLSALGVANPYMEKQPFVA